MMNCEQFQNVMLDLARDAGEEGCEEMLDAATVKDALEHADTCGTCDELLEEAEAVSLALRELAVRHSSEQAPARVESALLHRLELRRALAMRSAWRRRSVIGSVSGVAAAALLAITLLWHGGVPGSRPAQNALPASSAVEAPANVDGGSGNSEFAESQAGWLSGFGDDEKSAGSFVPLSQTFDSASMDDDTVVRVVLSRAALDSFGLHLAADAKIQAGSQVVADLIVTNDGTPQAIRVVGW
jgi:ferric-dicitrate binding protein FerR (iron transport regulator)